MKTLRVLLVDDHPVVRHGLRKMLEAAPDIEVVGEAGETNEALEKVRVLRPDIAVVDVQLPGASGVELVKAIGKLGVGTRCLILSAHRGGDLVLRAVKAGARGYLPKGGVDGSVLAEAIRAVCRGEMALHPAISNDLATALSGLEENLATEALTEREAQVLMLIAQGMRNKEIALELGLTEATVKHHVGRLFDKLGVGSRTEALVKARKLGLLTEQYTAL